MFYFFSRLNLSWLPIVYTQTPKPKKGLKKFLKQELNNSLDDHSLSTKKHFYNKLSNLSYPKHLLNFVFPWLDPDPNPTKGMNPVANPL